MGKMYCLMVEGLGRHPHYAPSTSNIKFSPLSLCSPPNPPTYNPPLICIGRLRGDNGERSLIFSLCLLPPQPHETMGKNNCFFPIPPPLTTSNLPLMYIDEVGGNNVEILMRFFPLFPCTPPSWDNRKKLIEFPPLSPPLQPITHIYRWGRRRHQRTWLRVSIVSSHPTYIFEGRVVRGVGVHNGESTSMSFSHYLMG